MNNKELFTLADAERRIGPRAFCTLVKPGGSACNLACKYCYYLDKANLYGGREPVMDQELLEIYIKQFIDAVEAGPVEFCWHGGEPLMLGLDYFKKAMKLQRKYAGNKEIHNSIQTNGTLVDESWCRFFAENDFLVGLSIDGYREIHNENRVNKGQRPTFDKVASTADLFRRYNVQFNTLTVVNKVSEGHGLEIYRFLRDRIGSSFMQFLPACDWLEDGSLAPWSVSAEGYGRFLCDIFDEWVHHDIGMTYVQIFDNTLAQWCGMQSGICTLGETCGDGLAVEHNGDVYPCDHFVSPENRLGNIRENTLSELYDSKKRVEFALIKRNGLDKDCFKCEYYRYCHGECPGHRDGSKSALCGSFKMFFRHITPAMNIMRDLLLQGKAPADIMMMDY